MPSRRRVLRGLALAPVLALVRRAEARDYTSPSEVLAEIDRLESDVDLRLDALASAVPAAAAFARRVHADHERHRASRAALRKRLHLAVGSPPPLPHPSPSSRTLPQAQAVAQDLVHVYAEGLPALGDALAVDTLARAMVDDARHLAVLQMWSEAEETGG